MDRYQAGELLWQASPQRAAGSRLAQFMGWLASERGRRLTSYHELWQWSVDDLEGFWAAVWDYFEVSAAAPYQQVLASRDMPGAQWFTGARLNWAEHALRHDGGDEPALVGISEGGEARTTSWSELRGQVGALAEQLRRWGVGPGDRVAAVLPNVPEAVIGVLATAAVGAVWACAAPEFGPQAVIDRLAQLRPSVLLLTDGYHFGGKTIDRRALAVEVRQAIPQAQRVAYLRYAFPDEGAPAGLGEVALWEDLVAEPAPPRFEPVDFDHPLWVLFTSGTTGLPKGIVHGHGGIVVEQYKTHSLMFDLGPEDRLFFTASTSWVVWNLLITALQVGTSVVLYDGNPTWPDAGTVWRITDELGVTALGFGSAYIGVCQGAGLKPGTDFDLSRLDLLMVTGSPLPLEGWYWIYEAVSRDVQLSSASGGTEVCTAFVGGVVTEPVRATELGPAWLGVQASTWDEQGLLVVGEVGELVVTAPMPSMPVSFWDDPDGRRYRESYFDTWPGVWRHGDWATETDRGTFVIHGRSDATINRHGIRLGSAEVYAVVEHLAEVTESLVVGAELPGDRYYMPLFVVLADGITLTDELRARLVAEIRSALSPRAVPDEIIQAPGVPHTITGKRLEVPVKRLLQGAALADVVSLDAVDRPDVVEWYADFATSRRGGG